MKITMTICLGHVVNDNGTIEVKDSNDVPFEDIETTNDAEGVIAEALAEALTDCGFEWDSLNIEWD